MKSINLLVFASLILMLGSCGFFKNYSKDDNWSYFEEWDNNTDTQIDKDEFVEGCVRDGFVSKSDATTASAAFFTKADEDQNGFLSGLEFYRWKIKM